ncbi:SH3 domain-containing C40 family peptidase [Cohnella zeiphila]|uniref:C40 family peptidase n=1 Tax=Cohnella zeiphila TaxID=2761120 RepID=UPI001EE2AC62|nr:SH3 domain-containing C40 family peptidase [Cohnella zeiphila]
MRRNLLIALTAAALAASIPVTASASANAGQASVVATVSFRTAPSTLSGMVRYLKPGETVELLEKTNNYWWKVQDSSGRVGYVSSSDKYVKQVSSPSANPAPGTSAGTNAVIVSTVSLREAPSTSGKLIRYLKKAEAVTVTGQVNSYWYAVTAPDGQTGYVSTSSKYISLTGAVSTPTTGGSSNNGSSGSGTGQADASAQVEAVIAAGMKYLGTPYEYGSSRSTTTTFDCSDFVRQAFKDALGITLPADSRGQGDYVRSHSQVTTDWKQLKRGDLMFFMDYKGTSASSYTSKQPFSTRISHVGIYLGDGKILQTYSKESGGVRVDSIAGKHWEYRFLFGGSAL